MIALAAYTSAGVRYVPMLATDRNVARVRSMADSGDLEMRRRNRARRALRTRAPYIIHLAEVICISVNCRDPGDALEFVRRLELLCGNILDSSR